MSFRIYSATVACSMLIGLSPSLAFCADFLNTLPATGNSCCYGEHLNASTPRETFGAYVGQTFIAPAHPLQDVTFDLSNVFSVGPTYFTLLVTPIEGELYSESPTGEIVFESGVFVVPHNEHRTFTVDLNAVQLVEDEQYAILIDTNTMLDGIPDKVSIRTRGDNPYLDGHKISRFSGPGRRREEDWNNRWSSWSSSPAIDWSIRITLAEAIPSPPLQAGDVNQDYAFDQLDLVAVFLANKYLTGQPATWGEGDWDGAPGGSPGNPPAGDSIFDQRDIIAALSAGTYLTGPYQAIQPNGRQSDSRTSIVYDPNTGELEVDSPAGAELTSINVESASGIFTADAAQNLGGRFDVDSDESIFKATFGSSFGSTGFGNVAQAGLSEEFLLGDLAVDGSLSGGGALGVDLVYVPEPSAIALSLLGLTAIVCGFRR